MRVAVTGASGFIGTHVVASLAARGDTAIPITRPFDPAALTSALQFVDVVIHLAGVVSAVRREDFFTANVGATEVVPREARPHLEPGRCRARPGIRAEVRGR